MALGNAFLEVDRRCSAAGSLGVARVSAVFSTTRVRALSTALAFSLTSLTTPLATRSLGLSGGLAPMKGGPLPPGTLALAAGRLL